MRLDLFLKKTCVVKSRAAAKTVCDAGAAAVNGRTAKASQELRVGDVIALHFVQRDLELHVLDLPHGNVSKRDAGKYFELLRDDAVTRDDRVGRVLEGFDGAGDDGDVEDPAAER
jgi:ribosomal 50S subunit-recycling heat shock protein